MRTAVVVFGLALTSCYSPDHAELQREVDALAPAGRDLAMSVARMGAAGFDCQGMRPVICYRGKDAFMMGCTQLVELHADAATWAVARADAGAINCKGL